MRKLPIDLRTWAGTLRRYGLALYLARRDPRVPTVARILIVVAVAYAVNPIDLIPDFIPVLGYVDDLVLLPLLVWLALRMVPETVWRDCVAAAERISPADLPHTRGVVWAVVVIWVLVLGAVLVWLWPALGAWFAFRP